MKITSTGLPQAPAATRAIETEPAPGASSSARAPAALSAQPLQSAVMGPALQALREMPEVDLERVGQLRDALAKGAVPFDAAKLAGLITRFHGGRS